jgi:hypothetical protein
MSFNDLGNFIGRICRRFDLKYGDRGLAYVYRRADGNYRADLEVTLDFARICAFLGLNHDAWSEGFGSLPEMFAWVVESPWFLVAPYLDEINGNLQKQAAERTTVSRFVGWLRAKGIDQEARLRGPGELSAGGNSRVPRGRPARADRARAGGRGPAPGVHREVQRETGDAARTWP